MAGLQPTLSQLRPALQLALEVAAAAPGPLPGRVRNLVRSRRLPGSWPVTIRQALEEEEAFRQVVSAEADEEGLGRVAWLWLTRPDGWEDELDDLLEASLDTEEQERDARLAAERIAGLEAELARARADTQAATNASSALEGELAEWRRQATRLEEQLRWARAEAERATDEGRQALERARSLEADNVAQARRLAALHAQLDRTEAARRQARSDAEAAVAGRMAAEADRLRVEAGEQGLRRAIGPAVGRAAAAARELGEALAEASRLLAGGPAPGPDRPAPGPGPGTPPGAGPTAPPLGPGRIPPPIRPGRPGPQPGPVPAARPEPGRPDPAGGRDRPRRRPLRLPPAVFDDSPEAATHLVRAAGVHLVVDGYNVTFTSWTGNDLPALRHRLVTALSELVVRVKLPVSVVFDGADEGGRVAAPPVARPWLRIVFSASSVEADEVIVEAVRALPAQIPVVVVTNDRQVRADVGRLGANVLSVDQFLGVLGRQPGGAPGS